MKLEQTKKLTIAALVALLAAGSTASAETMMPKAKDHSSFFRQLSNFQHSLNQSAAALQAAADAPQPEDIRLGLHKYPKTPYDNNEVTPQGAVQYKNTHSQSTSPNRQHSMVQQPVAIAESQSIPVVRTTMPVVQQPVSQPSMMPVQEAVNPMNTSMPLQTKFTEVSSLYKIDGWERLQGNLTITKNGRPYQKVLTYVVLPGEKERVSMSGRTKTNTYYENTNGTSTRVNKVLFTTLVDYVAPINDYVYTVHMEITTPNDRATDFSITKGITKSLIKSQVPAAVALHGDQTKTPMEYSFYLDTDRWFAGKTVATPTEYPNKPGSSTTVVTETPDASVVVTVSTDSDKAKEEARDFAYTLARYVHIKDLV